MEKLQRYKGELTLEQLILARNKILENAKSLYEDAILLYENSRLARAHYLLCIADEEIGKSLIVMSAIVDLITESINWHHFWKLLRSHKDKTHVIEYVENIFVSSEKNFTPPEEIQTIIPILEEFKMASLYSDMFQNNFFNPNELVSQLIVTPHLKLTGNRLDYFTSIVVSDESLRSMKKEDLLALHNKLHDMMKDYDDSDGNAEQ